MKKLVEGKSYFLPTNLNPVLIEYPICVATFVLLNVPVKAVTVQMLCTHSLSTRYQFIRPIQILILMLMIY